jgi:malonyl CoA-acyl carrier protein transacylase
MPSRIRCVGFFPGLGSRAAYKDADRGLLKSAFPTVRKIYVDAAESLRCDPQDFFAIPDNLTALERHGLIGATVLVQSLSLREHLKVAASAGLMDLEFAAYTGESFGIITSAVAAGAISCNDGVKIANIFTPLMMLAADGLGIDEPFAQTNMAYLIDLLEGERLVAEPSHVIALHGGAAELQDALREILKSYSKADVEVHKLYSPRQTNIYVRAGVRADFENFMKNYPAVSVMELKAPTTFLAHSERMHRVRLALDRYIEEGDILFRNPITPLVSNDRAALLTTADEVREAILAITDRVMASMDTIRVIRALDPDVIIELGHGNKSVQLIVDNDVPIPAIGYTGTSLAAVRLLDAVKTAQGCDKRWMDS